MTWTVSASGTSSALTTGSENTLATDTTNGTYVFMFNLSPLSTGDLIEGRVYVGTNSTALTAATQQAWKGTWQNQQINDVKISPPIAANQSIGVSLKQINSSGSSASGNSARAIVWTLLRI